MGCIRFRDSTIRMKWKVLIVVDRSLAPDPPPLNTRNNPAFANLQVGKVGKSQRAPLKAQRHQL